MVNNTVNINVGKNFFDKIFEPKRRSLEKKLGIKLSQAKFTEYLTKKDLGIIFPKMKGIPKQFRGK